MTDKPTYRFRWTVGAFSGCGGAMLLMLGWMLWMSDPARWCAVAATASPEITTGCVSILLKLLEIHDHVAIGLMSITGLSLLALAYALTGASLKLSGPGGLEVDVGSKDTTVSDGVSEVTVPTPPSNG